MTFKYVTYYNDTMKKRSEREKTEVQPLTGKGKLFATLLIPFAYVIISIMLDVALFAFLGWSFPTAYIFSLALIVLFAALISCIPSRVAQLVIFSVLLSFKAFAVVGMTIAYEFLGEMFALELFRSIREVLSGNEVIEFNSWGPVITVIALVGAFVAFGIFIAVKYKRHRAGYGLKQIIAAVCIVAMCITTWGIAYMALPEHDNTLTANQANKRFALNTFNMNRHFYLQSFGMTLFLTRNIIEVINLGPFFTVQGLYEGHLSPELRENTPLEHMLNQDYNLIMFMLEAIELDAINPFLTPNLWRIKSMSTWVDGYYATERTSFTEYTALTGSGLRGNEMHRDFHHVYVPHALPNIFRRAGHDQVAAFHNFQRSFYRRDQMFVPHGLGFHRLFCMDSYPGTQTHSVMEHNSDREMFETMINDMVPKNQTFFSYILNVGSHAPHFISRAVFPNGNTNNSLGLGTVPQFQRAFNEVYEMLPLMQRLYPRLNGNASERRGVMAYLTTIRDLDIGIGIMLDRLETTPDHRFPGKFLIDTTAMVLFSDHYNYVTNMYEGNNGQGLLSRGQQSGLIGDRLPFIIFNPRDTQTRGLEQSPGAVNPATFELGHISYIGNRIERFMSNLDIYRTITHLFNIRTSDKFTLGVSVFEPNSYSVGVGFSSGWFWGVCLTTNRHFRTRDMINFGGVRPCNRTMEIFLSQVNTQLATMLATRPFFENNSFWNSQARHYRFW